MRRSIGCLVVAALAVATLRHVGGWPVGLPSPRGPATWWGALSFALAAVVDTDREA